MNSNTVVEQVVKTIIVGIEEGTFTLGQRLPSQRELSDMFGVSRMVIREAVKVMEGMGILISRRGSGIYVKQDHPEQASFSLGGITQYSLDDMLTLSKLIWESSVPLIIANATDEELADLHKRVQKMSSNYSSTMPVQTKYIYESSFGMMISKLTHNQLVYRIMLELFKATSAADFLMIKKTDSYRRIINIDLNLTEALLQRDEQRARFWSRERNREMDKVIAESKELSESKN